MVRNFVFAAAPLLLLCAAPALCQEPDGRLGAGPLVVEQEVRERWLQGGQHPGFVPFELRRNQIHVRPRSAMGDSEWWYIDFRGGSWDGTLQLDPRNHLISVRIDPGPISVRDQMQPGMVDTWQRHHAALRGRIATLWEVPVTLPAEDLAPGVRWTDTLTFSVEPAEGALEMLEGTWEYEVTGDTVVDGRRLPWVRTTAEVRHRWVETVPDAGMVGDLRVERRTSGTLVGGAALDRELGLRIVGADTASWEGTAVLHTQDGRSFEAPVSYERFRRWALSDST